MLEWTNSLAIRVFYFGGFVFIAVGLAMLIPLILPKFVIRRWHRKRVQKWQRTFGYKLGQLNRTISIARPSRRRIVVMGSLFLIAGIFCAGGWYAETTVQMPTFTGVSFVLIPILVILNLMFVRHRQ